MIEPGGKKRKVLGAGGVPNKRGYNLKNRKSLNGASGVSTPATEGLESGQSTPMVEDEDEEEAEAELVEALPPGKEVFTCKSDTCVHPFNFTMSENRWDEERGKADRRSHSYSTAKSAAEQEILRHHRSSRELY